MSKNHFVEQATTEQPLLSHFYNSVEKIYDVCVSHVYGGFMCLSLCVSDLVQSCSLSIADIQPTPSPKIAQFPGSVYQPSERCGAPASS